MRKISLLALLSVLLISSCTSAPETNKDIVQGKVLVVYFSATGTTERIASEISSSLNADIHRILPLVPYTSDDLRYYTGGRADTEQADSSARPTIANDIDIRSYDIIFLGYPIWHGQAPRIISTFLELHDFTGKIIIPFCTSGSSDIASSEGILHALVPNADWIAGRRFDSMSTKTEIGEWIKSLDIDLENNIRKFDLVGGRVMLNSGYEMPIYGIGTYSLHGDTAINAVKTALVEGVRLIDTAHIYGNEEEVGRALRESGVPREEIFVITKLYPNQFSNPEAAIEESLTKLDIGYIDMMLLHHPGTNDVKAYKAIEKYIENGLIRSAGLSNWYVEELEDFLPKINITPALVQNEIHPYYQENDVIQYIQSKGIVVQGWYPLGGRGHTAALLSDSTISSIAEAHGKTSAQIILRWNLQNGVVVIPGSSNPAHIKENTELFDFFLTDEEMSRIYALDRNEKHDWY